MDFRSLLKSATATKALGFGATAQPAAATIVSNQEALALEIISNPRKLRRYEAQALVLLAGNRSARNLGRSALYSAAACCGRHQGPTVTIEPRLNKASTARLAFWATDTDTPV